MSRQRILLLFFLASCFAISIIQCTEQKKEDVRGEQYAGEGTCVQCHKEIAQNYIHNAHFNTSKELNAPHATDSLALPEGTFVFNEKTKVGVEKKVDGLYQVAYVNGQNMKQEKLSVAFGAGITAYTFAYWYGNKMMQLPLNYLVHEQQWVNSPGFPVDQIYFGRAIVTRCLECHSSFVQSKLVSAGSLKVEEEYVKNSLIAGIDCQRCHGPSAAHVQYHEEHPTEKRAKHMIGYNQLSRSQKVDMCSVCHSGINLQMLNPIFFFKPGDTLRNLPEYTSYTGEDPDVHGKQKQLLEASKCYKLSNMDCGSCHSTHDDIKPDLAVYSQKCIKCHTQVEHVSLDRGKVSMLEKNCIDCHMPVKVSKDIGFQVSGSKEKIPYKQRTHRIAVYK
ncbi:cytochrome c3 family protein [Olivibacter domesticus]|uniref:Uncharacterized protein n=1 Tax=Olivibacter domesticus TaxID=407022 RepID=A0A1H7Y8P0_OLID1|nr:cytochrome c3 family protein [Olivibacter domesticus]SEM42305.1 hypothetical protein SAMN05661044_05152 [Olivibacter domesticus]